MTRTVSHLRIVRKGTTVTFAPSRLLRLSALIIGFLASAARGDSLGWRGDSSGRYPLAAVPDTWDCDQPKNVVWQTKVGKGQSTPILVGSRVLLAVEPDLLVCVDRATGKRLWSKGNGYDTLPANVKTPAKKVATSAECGYASSTPLSDGRSVYTVFGTGIVVAYDLEGNRRWLRLFDVPLVTQYGRAVSPVLAGGKLIVGLGGMIALDPATGATVWQNAQAKPTYGTPAVASIDGTPLVFTSNGDCVRAADGQILARRLGRMEYASPLVHEGVLYYVDAESAAYRLPAKVGDRLQVEQLWENGDLEGKFFASPLWNDGVLYTTCDEGTLFALEATSGKVVFQQELPIGSQSGRPGHEPASLYPSPTLVGKSMLVGNNRGEMLLLTPGREYRQQGRNFLDAGSGASPVADGSQLFLRGGEHLYCIGAK